MKKTLGIIALTLLVAFALAITFIPSARQAFNEYAFGMKRIDQETDYTNRKMVEDSARSMIANYEFAKAETASYASFCATATYDKARCQRSLDAKASANKTASNYNNYILKNRYLWKNNLPSDIFLELAMIP